MRTSRAVLSFVGVGAAVVVFAFLAVRIFSQHSPSVDGQILKLNVQDNKAVKEGDVLFEIDPEDYRLILEKAKADLANVDQQLAQARSTLQRLEPLLPNRFTTPDTVDKARTAVTT